MIIQFIVRVAINPLMFPSSIGGEFRSMRLAAFSADPLPVAGPGTPVWLVGGERCVAGLFSWA